MCHIQHCHSTRFDSTPFDKGMPGSHRMAVVETCQPGLHYAMGSRWRQWGHWAHDWFPDHPDRPSTGSSSTGPRCLRLHGNSSHNLAMPQAEETKGSSFLKISITFCKYALSFDTLQVSTTKFVGSFPRESKLCCLNPTFYIFLSNSLPMFWIHDGIHLRQFLYRYPNPISIIVLPPQREVVVTYPDSRHDISWYPNL